MTDILEKIVMEQRAVTLGEIVNRQLDIEDALRKLLYAYVKLAGITPEAIAAQAVLEEIELREDYNWLHEEQKGEKCSNQ